MAAEIAFLIPEFRSKVQNLLAACAKRSVRMELFRTLISPFEQAELWREGRSPAEIEMKILALQNAKATFLAQCLRGGKTNTTTIKTHELPGFSWHQWAEAVACVWVDSSNKIVWSKDWIDKPRQHNGYAVYQEEAINLGLTPHPNWNTVTFRPEQSPDKVYSLAEIEAEMQKRYRR